MEILSLAAWVTGSYLVGSIPFGLLLGKIVFGVDIREKGSKNLGATNAGRVLGGGRRARTFAFFIIIYLLDSAKGFFPAWLGARYAADAVGIPPGLLTGAAAILGHMAPVYLLFRGGKGVAVSSGVVVALVPGPFAVAAVVFGLGVGLSRMVSVGSLAAAVALPAAVLAFGYDTAILVAFLALSMLVVVKHRGNIVRLVRGTENRIGGRKPEEKGAPREGTTGNGTS
jgi:glycerol-3-phosphate acyltransferase PlsY